VESPQYSQLSNPRRSFDSEVRKTRLYHYQHAEYSEIDRAARIEGNPEQRHNELTEIRADSRAFYIEFAIAENFLEVRELRPALPNFSAQLFFLRIRRDILCSSFNLRTKLICMKHQFGECFSVFIHQNGIVFSRLVGASSKVSRYPR